MDVEAIVVDREAEVLEVGVPGPTGPQGPKGDQGEGDMVAATYDPQGVAADAFDRARHTGQQPLGSVTGLTAALDGKDAAGAASTAVTNHEAAPNPHSQYLQAETDPVFAVSEAAKLATGDKAKLDGIEAGANAYTHPAAHPATIITEDAAHRFATDVEKAAWSAKQDALGFTPEDRADKGTAGGYAELDGGGKVPAAQLPSYVDDVIEAADFSALPATGETGKIYVTLDDGKTWRWSGSGYSEISASLALGETSSTAYRGDRGKSAYDHSQSTGNPHGTTAVQTGADPAGTAAQAVTDHEDAANPHDQYATDTDLSTHTGKTGVDAHGATTTPTAGAIPVAGSTGQLDPGWLPFALADLSPGDIGTPGTAGFGVGICPTALLPPGMIPMYGAGDRTHPNYGNYQYQDGSVMCFVPRYWYKIGDGANGLPAGLVDVAGLKRFADTTQANAAGYALHRAFIDGGVEQQGVFVDKYLCSKNAWGAGFVASSLKDGLPLSTHPDHNPIADLTACDSNNYYQAINAAKARDGVDGAINPASRFFCASRFAWAALALISLAHGQAATSATYCAWYDAGGATNYPKGCNNNALGDVDDGEVQYVSDGYSNCAKTGSGAPFAKTTHNGQACGVADVNGLMYEIQIGITCVASYPSITGVSQTNPAVVTCPGHGLVTGQAAQIYNVAGMTELNDRIYTVTVVDADSFALGGVDSSGFAAYTGGGTVVNGQFYAAREAARMRDFTAGNSGATDHWGATGVASMMEPIDMPLRTDYPNNGSGQRWGNGANAVLDGSLSGAGWLRTGLGLPKNSQAVSASGTNLFGSDYLYQYIRNELCLIASLNWGYGSNAGPWGVNLSYARTYAYNYVSFRAACYPGG